MCPAPLASITEIHGNAAGTDAVQVQFDPAVCVNVDVPLPPPAPKFTVFADVSP
jgi:hypothetical protein